MTRHTTRNGEIVILPTIHPNTILIPIIDRGLEELRDIALRALVGVIILTNSLANVARIGTGALVPEVDGAADRLARRGTGHGQRVAVDERHVAVGGAGGGEETFELGAAGARVGVWADEHGAARAVAGGDLCATYQ